MVLRDGAWITEYSVKYSPTAAAKLAQRAGWRINNAGMTLKIIYRCICFSRQTERNSTGSMKTEERRQAIKQQREQLIQELEAVYLAALDRLEGRAKSARSKRPS